MIENIASVINSIVDWMQCAILDIDGYSFSMWEILVVGKVEHKKSAEPTEKQNCVLEDRCVHTSSSANDLT